MFEEKVVGKAIERRHSRVPVRFRAVGIVLPAFLLLLLAQTATPAMAQPIFPTSYNMRNGNNENLFFLDRSYDGAGDPTQPSSFLSDGLGDLADGIIATQNWSDVEPAPPANGPYVGWDITKPFPTPTITFHFGCTANIDSVTVHADDSGGAGGVSTPSSINVSMGGLSQSFDFPDPSGTAPVSATFSLNLNPDTSLTLTVKGAALLERGRVDRKSIN